MLRFSKNRSIYCNFFSSFFMSFNAALRRNRSKCHAANKGFSTSASSTLDQEKKNNPYTY